MYPEKVAKLKADIQNWWNDCTKGTRLEGKTTFNSGWMVELMNSRPQGAPRQGAPQQGAGARRP